ncbi:Mth938-like domain-containing protein [Roseibium sp.]|uniref:Mth938-like domain-containing protein n=1 Tax=Roseibium sp. TaxID=1936156 RepID=UPI003A97C9DC
MTETPMVQIRDAHFPSRTPVDAYGNGGFRFAGMSHQGSILCVPSGVYGWEPKTYADLSLAAFEKVLEEVSDIEVLLIGTGVDLRPVPAELKAAFREVGIISDSMSTGAAIRTFNVMLAEERAVATALLAVDYER